MMSEIKLGRYYITKDLFLTLLNVSMLKNHCVKAKNVIVCLLKIQRTLLRKSVLKAHSCTSVQMLNQSLILDQWIWLVRTCFQKCIVKIKLSLQKFSINRAEVRCIVTAIERVAGTGLNLQDESMILRPVNGGWLW